MERDCDAPRDWSYRRNSTLRDWRIAFQTYSTTLANEHNTGHQTRTSPNSHCASTSWYSINRLRTSAGKMVQSKRRFCTSAQCNQVNLPWIEGTGDTDLYNCQKLIETCMIFHTKRCSQPFAMFFPVRYTTNKKGKFENLKKLSLNAKAIRR